MLTKQISEGFKDIDAKSGIVQGYFSHFDSLDSDGDYISKGAFAKTIKEQGPTGANRVRHLMNHDKNRLLGVPTEIAEDTTGAFYTSQLLVSKDASIETPSDVALIIIGHEHKMPFEHSFGYGIIKEQRTSKGNNLQELHLKEFSTLTHWGANSNTPLLSLKSEEDLEATLSGLIKEIHRGNYNDATYLVIESKIKEISDVLAEKRKQHHSADNPVTEPEADEKAAPSLLSQLVKAL